jgi:hypothetical protein
MINSLTLVGQGLKLLKVEPRPRSSKVLFHLSIAFFMATVFSMVGYCTVPRTRHDWTTLKSDWPYQLPFLGGAICFGTALIIHDLSEKHSRQLSA